MDTRISAELQRLIKEHDLSLTFFWRPDPGEWECQLVTSDDFQFIAINADLHTAMHNAANQFVSYVNVKIH